MSSAAPTHYWALRVAYNRFQTKLACHQFLLAAKLFSELADKANFDPNQPRVPAGRTGGGRWTSSNRRAQFRPRTGHYRAKPAKVVRRETLLKLEKERQQVIKRTLTEGKITGEFHLDPNPDADPEAPPYARHGRSDVGKFRSEIDRAAAKYQVDANLIRAIMYVETTQGRYDSLGAWVNMNRSILPMNINIVAWGDFLGTREELEDPLNNIMAGARLIRAISQNFSHDPSIAEIASLYNTLRTTIVTNFGSRVEKVYHERTWER